MVERQMEMSVFATTEEWNLVSRRGWRRLSHAPCGPSKVAQLRGHFYTRSGALIAAIFAWIKDSSYRYMNTTK